MARTSQRLNNLVVLRAEGRALIPDGSGLYLQVSATGSKSWLFRYKRQGRQHWMGLGAYPAVSLQKARRDAHSARELLAAGTDPLAHRDAVAAQARKQDVTFRQCAEDLIASQRAGWRNEKHASQWSATLSTYVFPICGDTPAKDIDTATVLKILRLIWETRPETATRVRQRVEAVINWAIAHGHSEQANPARWRGHLDKLLPKRSKVRAVVHHPAMEVAEIPRFFAQLRARNSVSALALQFTILTAARSGEVRASRWPEINLDQKIWTIPAENTKAHRAHRVPLSAPALAILEVVSKLQSVSNGVVFPGMKSGQPLSETTMLKTLQQELGFARLTVHGFRSTFRDWAGEMTSYPREVAEAALAHSIRDKAEAAYARGDLLERRRKMMDEWAAYCTSRSE